MLICSPSEAKVIYREARDAAVDAAEELNLPTDNEDYRDFRNTVFASRSFIDDGAFRYGFRVRGYVLKVPKSWAGARQNMVEHYTAMANVPFAPTGTYLIMHKYGEFVIPVLAVPFQDLSVRNSGEQVVWRNAMFQYNYSGDWAQFGKHNGRYVLTDWALVPGDLDRRNGKYTQQNTQDNEFICGHWTLNMLPRS